jgi:alanine or glycine:cation symporter, AGCS family
MDLLTHFNTFFTLFCVFPFVIGLGLYLTFKLNFVQLSKLKLSLTCLLKKEEAAQGNISYYQAISAVLAGNFGTGNISGMAVAITTGGPGALVWMWVMAFFGSVIQYASCLLGVKYREQNAEGEFVGGPMYYLSRGLGYKRLAALFAVFTIFAAVTVDNLAQINSITLPLQNLGVHPLLGTVLLAFFVGIVLLGGLQRVAKLASFIVPVKAFVYLGTALLIIVWHLDQVLPAFKLMFQSAFNFYSFTGGVAGFGVIKAMTTGFDRGLFATDAGTGIVPILQASAKTNNPVIDGVVTLVVPFLVMIVCTATGLILIMTGAWQQLELRSTNMVTYAFDQGLGSTWGTYIVISALVLFAYTTILAWACCAEKAIGFLAGRNFVGWFRYLYIACIPMGALLHVDIIWILADIAIALMLIVNLIGVAKLSEHVVEDSRLFFANQIPLTA